MSTPKDDRPDLTRRRPRPAPDERVDPVDYRGSVPITPLTPQEETARTPAAQERSEIKRSKAEPAQRATKIGRPRRDPTINFSTRLSPEIIELIDKAVARGEGDGVIRNVVEEAIRFRWSD